MAPDILTWPCLITKGNLKLEYRVIVLYSENFLTCEAIEPPAQNCAACYRLKRIPALTIREVKYTSCGWLRAATVLAGRVVVLFFVIVFIHALKII